MKYMRKDLAKDKIEVVITLDKADIEPIYNNVIEEKSKDLKVAGFRKGKVPTEVAKKYLNDEVLKDDVIGRCLNKALTEVIVKEQIQPLDRPNVDVTKFVPFDTLECKVGILIIPPIKLGGYMDLKAKKSETKVSNEDVDKLIENLRQQVAEKKEVKRAAKEGDEVTIDFLGKKGGKEFDGGKAENVPLVLGSKQMIPGFESGIEGHKAGEDFTIKVTFPKEYHSKDLAGAKAEFEIKLHKVSEIVLPKLDDKLVPKFGPFYTVKELKEAAKKELAGRAEFEATEKFKADLMAELVKKSKINVPEVLIDDQKEALITEAEDNFKYRGLTPEQYYAQREYKDREDWIEKEVKPEAERRVKSGLVLAELAKVEKVEVTDAEINAAQKQLMDQHTDPKLKERFDNPEARRNIANRIATEKALGKLVSYNQ
jgi:trigger factor